MTRLFVLSVLLALAGCSPRFCLQCDPAGDATVKAWQEKISAVVSEHDRRLIHLEDEFDKEKDNGRGQGNAPK